jgi:hypothetical protein
MNFALTVLLVSQVFSLPPLEDRKIVYNRDDRKDVCETVDEMWTNIARNSIAAIMDVSSLGSPKNGIYEGPKNHATLTSRYFSQKFEFFC